MKFRNRELGTMVVWLAFGAAGCGGSEAICLGGDGQAVACETGFTTEHGGGAERLELAPLSERLAALDVDLAVGAHGPEVRAVHDYLNQYGYFRNDDIRADNPLWRPFVDDVPADLETFDDVTLRAVSWFQKSSGLDATGVVDEPTRARLRAPRCPMPDGLFEAESPEASVEKFRHSTRLLTDLDLKWNVGDISGLTSSNFLSATCISAGCDPANVKESVAIAFHNAFETWERQAGVKFTRVSDIAASDIQVRFLLAPSAETYIMRWTPLSTNSHTVTLNTRRRFFVGREVAIPNIPDQNWYDVETLALHEIGHVLGLNHSSVNGNATTPSADDWGASMLPIAAPSFEDWVLHPDDDVAASTKYQTWKGMPTVDVSGLSVKATDIAVGNTHAWVVSDRPVAGGGFTIHSINIAQGLSGAATTWSNHATGGHGARRIAAGQANQPWIINGSGRVMERTGTSWSYRGTASDCAYDIGVGGGGPSGTGAVWILGCAVNAAGNHAIYRWNGSAWVEPNPGSAGWRISVDHSGMPWLITADDSIWRRPWQLNNWQLLPGSAIDIGAGPTANGYGALVSYVYVTGPDQKIWSWTEQVDDPVTDDADETQPGTWIRALNGTAVGVATAANGAPWVRAANGTVWAQR